MLVVKNMLRVIIGVAWITEVVDLKKKNVSSMFETEKYRFAGKLSCLVDELTSWL